MASAAASEAAAIELRPTAFTAESTKSLRRDLPTVGTTVNRLALNYSVLQLKTASAQLFCPVLRPRGPQGPTLLGGYCPVCQKDSLCQESQLKTLRVQTEDLSIISESLKKQESIQLPPTHFLLHKMKTMQSHTLVDSTGKEKSKFVACFQLGSSDCAVYYILYHSSSCTPPPIHSGIVVLH